MARTRMLLALLISLILLSAPMALAESEDDDDDRERDSARGESRERDDDRKAREDEDDEHKDRLNGAKRKVRLDVEGGKAQIKLSRETNISEDEIKIQYDARHGSFKVQYETENATTEIESELKVRFKEAVEFRDMNGDGAYDRNDTIVARHAIRSLDWTLEGPDAVTSGSGTPGQRLKGIGAFPGGGSLGFVLYVYGDFAEVNGTTVRPTEVKIDIILDHFPYTANDTLPALFVKSEQEHEIEVEGHNDGMRATAAGVAAYFSWADNATVDGVDTPVHTTRLGESSSQEWDDEGEQKEENEQRFALSYARGDFINHDPLIGIQSDDTQTRSVPNVGVIGFVIVGIAAVALRRRR